MGNSYQKSAISYQLSAISLKREAKTNKHKPGKTTISSHKGTKRNTANSDQQSAVSGQLEAIDENQVQHPLLPNFPAFGEFLGNSISDQQSAVSLKQ